ncbi:MAG: hypothetical protein ACOYMA_08010 [Bacteroidia bacterium]
MIVKSYKIILFFIFLFSSYLSNSQILNGFRFGGGVGESIYWGSQMDDKMSFSTYNKSEFNPGFNFQLYKAIDKKNEIGFRFLNTQLWSFKTSNTQATNAKINEFAIIYQRSLNENSTLNSGRMLFTHNLVLGLSMISFKSRAFLIDPKTKIFSVLSSVGYANDYTTTGLTKPEDQLAIGAVLGYNIGIRLNKSFSIYLENTFTLSTNNDIHGNLNSKSKITNNGYTYSALSLYLNINSRVNPLGCPKF